jgi:hypothetical protein
VFLSGWMRKKSVKHQDVEQNYQNLVHKMYSLRGCTLAGF